MLGEIERSSHLEGYELDECIWMYHLKQDCSSVKTIYARQKWDRVNNKGDVHQESCDKLYATNIFCYLYFPVGIHRPISRLIVIYIFHKHWYAYTLWRLSQCFFYYFFLSSFWFFILKIIWVIKEMRYLEPGLIFICFFKFYDIIEWTLLIKVSEYKVRKIKNKRIYMKTIFQAKKK